MRLYLIKISLFALLSLSLLVAPSISHAEFKFFQDYPNIFTSSEKIEYENTLRLIYNHQKVLVVVAVFADKTTKEILDELPIYYKALAENLPDINGHALVAYDINAKKVHAMFSPKMQYDIGTDFLQQFMTVSNNSIKTQSRQAMVNDLMEILRNQYLSDTQYNLPTDKLITIKDPANSEWSSQIPESIRTFILYTIAFFAGIAIVSLIKRLKK